MSLMTQSLLMEAQSLRMEGDLDGSIALLRVVISQCVADADTNQLTRELWRMASYQLALLLLQNSGRCNNSTSEREADTILMKLGYRLRLSTKAFGYPACECKSAYDTTKSQLLLIDDILPQSMFDALQHSLRPQSRYWSDFYSKAHESDDEDGRRRIFASHNVSLPSSTELTYTKCIEKASSLIEQVAIIVKHCLLQHFPSISTANSAEIWSHRRAPDAQHQLHYDCDELSLHSHRNKLRHKADVNATKRGNKRQKVENNSGEKSINNQTEDWTKDLCPIVSCVLTVNVPNEATNCDRCGRLGDGAPTLVCNQSLSGGRSNEGWLCYPQKNRLTAFDGSLLHAVVPGIPSETLNEDDNGSRVTFMIGFWKEVTLTVPDQTSQCLTIGPNVPFPSSLLDEFKPIQVDECALLEHVSKATDHMKDPNHVKPLWVEIKSEDAGKSDNLGTIGEHNFSGRFFLRSTDPNEIDNEVLGL